MAKVEKSYHFMGNISLGDIWEKKRGCEREREREKEEKFKLWIRNRENEGRGVSSKPFEIK